MAAPFTLVSAADAYSGTDYRTLYTVPAGKQAFIKSVLGMNTTKTSMAITLELMDNGVTPVPLSNPTVASLASTNMLAGTLVMSAGESLRQKSESDYLKGTQVFNSYTREINGGCFYDITYANSLFVAVGSGGALSGTSYNNNIYTSPDGVTWTWRDVDTATGTARTLYSITYGAGLFVVVGADGFIATSPDAVTWTTRTSAHGSNHIKQVIYAGGKFVAVGGSAPSNSIQTSPDGITWTARTGVQSIGTYASVAYDSTNAQYVMTTGNAANGTSPNGGIQTSPDGITWTARTGSHNSPMYCTAAKPGFMLCVDSNSNHTYSTDGGVTWSTLSQPLGLSANPNLVKVIGGIFYAIGGYTLRTSTDGLRWTARACSLQNGILASNGTKFVAAYDTGLTIDDFGADLTLSKAAAFTASVVEVAA